MKIERREIKERYKFMMKEKHKWTDLMIKCFAEKLVQDYVLEKLQKEVEDENLCN